MSLKIDNFITLPLMLTVIFLALNHVYCLPQDELTEPQGLDPGRHGQLLHSQSHQVPPGQDRHGQSVSYLKKNVF